MYGAFLESLMQILLIITKYSLRSKTSYTISIKANMSPSSPKGFVGLLAYSNRPIFPSVKFWENKFLLQS